MRLPTRRDRDRLGRAGGLILVMTLALGSPALGDGPDKEKAKDEFRSNLIDFASNRVEGSIIRTSGRVEQVFGAIEFLLNPPKNPWLDKSVVLKSCRTELLVDGKPVSRPDGRSFHKFTVKKVEPDAKGDRLYLVDGALKGWARETDVVPEDKARAYFTDLIAREPASAEAYYLRGALGKDREAGQALADLAEAIRLDPKFPEALVARGALYSEKSDSDRAIADFTEAIRINPDLAVAYRERAGVYEEKKDHARAIADLTEVIRIGPGDYATFALRGLILFNNETWDKAVADLTEAIRIGPGDVPFGEFLLDTVYFVRGESHRKLKQYDRAVADFTEAIRVVEAETFLRNKELLFVAVYQRAVAWDAKKDYDRAIEGFTDVIGRADKPKFAATGYAARARTRKNRKDLDGALADYAEALRHDPDPVVAAVTLMDRGRIASDRNDLESALSDLAKAVHLLPDSYLVYTSRAQILTDNGRYERALADCDQAVEVEPKSPWGHYYRAWIRATCPDAKFRDGKKALEGATRACEMTAWKQPSCLETLAAAEAESGDFDAAIKWQSRAIELVADEDDEVKTRFRDRLDLFRNKKPYRDVRQADGSRRASHDLPEVPLTSR